MGWINYSQQYAANTDYHSGLFNDVFITQLLENHLFWKNIKEDSEKIDKNISIFNFCPADATSTSYKTMKTADDAIADDELFEPDARLRRSW